MGDADTPVQPPAPPPLAVSQAPSGMLFATMQGVKSAEMFNRAIEKLQAGDLEQAILLLQEAEFFSPDDPTPLVAHAECYIYLCDLQSAIRYYRRALWVVQKRDNIDPTRKLATIVPAKNLCSSIPLIANSNSHCTDWRYRHNTSSETVTAGRDGSPVLDRSDLHSPLVVRRATKTLVIPSLTVDDTVSPTDANMAFLKFPKEGELAAEDEAEERVALSSGRQPEPPSEQPGTVSVARRSDLRELLLVEPNEAPQSNRPLSPSSPDWHSADAGDYNKVLSPALFRETADNVMQNSSSMWQNSRTQRMQKGPAEVQLVDIQIRLAGLLDAMSLSLFNMTDFVAALQCAEDSLALVEDPIVQLHRCIYLISLNCEEDAESLLEAHMNKYEECRIQTSALLIQLYVNRQAFRPARMLLDKYTGTTRYEDCLIIARHIFYTQYDRYRKKALEKKDVGTISKCIDVFPNDVELLFARAKIRIAEGDHKKSVKDLFRCVKETNGSHKEAIETMTSVLFTIGTSLDGEEGIQDAVVYYSESLKWRADNTLVLLARADCYVKLENYEEALMDYRRILQIQPDDPTASKRIAFLHDLWGRKLYRLKKVKDAEIEFTNAIRQCDTEPLFYYHRALCRFYLDEARYGLRDVLSCQQLNPTDPKIRAFVVRYLGSNDVPDTTKAFKQAEMRQLVSQDTGRGTSYLTNANAPPSSFATQKVATKYYGKPSARITKVLMEAQDASEAMGRGAMPMEKVIGSVHGANTKGHMGFVDFVCSNAPEGTVTVVAGKRAKICTLDPRVKLQRIGKPKDTKLPTIKLSRVGTASPSSLSKAPRPPLSASIVQSRGEHSVTVQSDVDFSSEVKISSAGGKPLHRQQTMTSEDAAPTEMEQTMLMQAGHNESASM